MIENEAKYYARFIKNLRKKEELSLHKFGERFSISGQTVSDIENGKTKKPNKKLITSIADFMKIEESSIYNEIYYGKSKHKSSPFNHDEFFNNLIKKFCDDKQIELVKKTEEIFNSNIEFLYGYLLSLKADWVMRYDVDQSEYMVRSIHYFDRRNVVYIITWCFAQIKYDLQIASRKSDLEIENIFLHAMFNTMKSSQEKPRTLRIVFDASDDEQVKVYHYLSNLKFKAPKFFIQFVLYDDGNKTSEEKIYK